MHGGGLAWRKPGNDIMDVCMALKLGRVTEIVRSSRETNRRRGALPVCVCKTSAEFQRLVRDSRIGKDALKTKSIGTTLLNNSFGPVSIISQQRPARVRACPETMSTSEEKWARPRASPYLFHTKREY